MNNPEQAVVAPEVGNDPPVEAEGDALDDLLKEYDSATQEAKPTEQPNESNELVGLLKRREEKDAANEAKEAERDVEKGLTEAIDVIQDQLKGGPIRLSNKAIDDILNGMARRDDRLSKAFDNRSENPQAWNRILKSTAKAISEDNSIDPELTEDREAVANAVKSATTATEADDQHTHESLSKMSDTEFEIWKSSLK